MQLLLTDRLTCPRCGPTFGLILLADRLVERRVLQGVLGCPNCRDSFPIVDGFADMRAPPRGDLTEGWVGAFEELRESPDEEGARIMALLGIVRGPGTVALVGGPSRHAAFLAAGVDDLHVVAVDPDLKSWPDSSGVSRLVSAPGLPFFSRMLRGVVVDGRLGEGIVAESARVLAPKSRLVVLGAGDLTRQLLVEAGLTLLAVESETVVAVRG